MLEKIKDALYICSQTESVRCNECPYHKYGSECSNKMHKDILKYLERKENKNA